MFKVFIYSLIFYSILNAQEYPKIYSKLATPLFKAKIIFNQYSHLDGIEKRSTAYSLDVDSILSNGYSLMEKRKLTKKERTEYLHSLRTLNKKYNQIIYELSKHMSQAIDRNDYKKFKSLVNISLNEIFTSNKLAEKAIKYYKKNKHLGKINSIEELINNTKIIPFNNTPVSKSTKQIMDVPSYIHDIYWTSSIGSNISYKGFIYGGNKTDISNSQRILDIGRSLGGVVSDEYGNIYWSDIDEKAILKSDVYGANVEVIVDNLTHPLGLAIDNKRKRIYWSDWMNTKRPQKGYVGYSDFDGQNRRTIIGQRLISGGQICIDSKFDKLYIADMFGKSIFSSDMEGLNLKLIAYSKQPSGIAVDYKNKRIVWSDSSSDAIYSAELDGSIKKKLIDFNDAFASPSSICIHHELQRLIYSVSLQHQGVIESSGLHGADRRVEFSAQKLYNVGGLFIRYNIQN